MYLFTTSLHCFPSENAYPAMQLNVKVVKPLAGALLIECWLKL